MIRILAHRGMWNDNIERNSPQALRRALESGFGFESDVRDYAGHIVISHNIANENCQNVEEVFEWLQEFKDKYCFAINVKADGLKDFLTELFVKYNVSNYFLFDMSVPQMIEFKEANLKFFTRQSEVEEKPCMYNDAKGVWIDGFWGTEWITEELIKNHILQEKEVCVVSPELHGRDNYREFWQRIKEFDLDHDKVMLCTDYPDEAREFFKNEK